MKVSLLSPKTVVRESPCCRGTITGKDWMRPDLQQKYSGYFSVYLQQKIDRLKTEIS